MTDITTELERLANLKPYDGWPADGAVSAICAAALAEIQRLRLDLAHNNALRFVWPVPDDLPYVRATISGPMICTERKTEPVAPMSGRFVPGVGGFLPMYPQTPAAPEPAPEPWGSSFAMNTENWK